MNKTFDVSGPVNVDVQLSSGDIRLERSDNDTAEVSLEAHDAEAQELIDSARVELRGRDLIIDVPGKQRGFNLANFFGGRGIICRVRCADHSSLRARTKSADIVVAIDLAEADIATASGDARLQNVDGDLAFKGASGDLRAGHVGGRASINTASGDIELRDVGGSFHANTASGDISVEAAHDDVKANTASGDVSVDVVTQGEIVVNSASGDVTVGVRRGSQVYLDCSTVSGDARSDLGPTGSEPAGDGPLVHLKARTVSGDIQITRAVAPAGHPEEVQA
ncbi:MAG TPA: DUF4097 family beta strand repeat-containing protein [Gaiellaceae bacterium]|nr:DUF4097 family beta strand repeat-containing protein [Gaiellaceae bacterium]